MASEPDGAPLHVGFAPSAYAPHKGGVEELVRQLASVQREAGVDTSVFTMRWPKDLPAAELIEGIPVYRYVFRSPEGGPRRVAVAAASNPATLGSYVRTLQREEVDLIHVQCVSHAAWFSLQAARILRIPLVVTLQGELTMDATQAYEHSASLRHTLRAVLTHADAVTACSASTLAEAEAWFGESLGDRARVVHNGVRVADFAGVEPHRSARPYVFGIGRHVPQKGFDVLIEAMAQLVGTPGFEHQLLLAGDGPEHPVLEALAGRLGIADRVTFLGATDRPTTASLFRGADVFVLASRHEPFGIVSLEAMAAGVPVVATDVGGVSEFVVDAATGLLVAAEDPAAIAGAIERIVADDNLRDALVAGGAATAAAHDWSAIAAEYRAVYDEVRS